MLLGGAASIAEMCVRPDDLEGRLGPFQHYCPVSLVDRGELIDCCHDSSQTFAAEFRGHYYKMASSKDLEGFLDHPERYTPPLVGKSLPPSNLLPRKRTAAEAKAKFPMQIELQGYCPVTYLDGDLRYSITGFVCLKIVITCTLIFCILYSYVI